MKLLHLFSSLTTQDLLLLTVAFLLFCCSAKYFIQDKYKLAVYYLLGSAFVLRIFMVLLDPFLHEWDERYHVLVAKSLLETPFTPRLLLDDVLSYNYQRWCCNYVWLHKQPWSLWQMAISMKVFGTEIWAARLPSVILNTFQVYLVYNIGRIIYGRRLGYFAALSCVFSYFALEQLGGFMGREHVDTSFVFYITASLWAWVKYIKAEVKYQWRWVIVIGCFAGIAVLNKWLPGLIIYGIWGIAFIVKKKKTWQEVGNGILSVIIACIIFLPWQYYIHQVFPLESAFESAFNRRHISEALEGYDRELFYYWVKNHILYGRYSWLLILLGFGLFFKKTDRQYSFGLATAVLTVYVFFTYAATKFIAYVFIVSPIIFLWMGMTITEVYELLLAKWQERRFLKPLLIVGLMVYALATLRLGKIIDLHYHEEAIYLGIPLHRVEKLNDALKWKEVAKTLPDNAVLLHVNQAVEVMFYTGRLAYFWVDQADIDTLVSAGYQPYLVPNPIHESPDYLKQDDRVKQLDIQPMR